MDCLVQRRSGQLITTSADAALQVGFAGLVASRRQAKMRADIARPSEAVRLVDRATAPTVRDLTETFNPKFSLV